MPKRLLLASQSPRRRQLLAEAGIPFQVAAATVDDTDLQPGSVHPGQWAAALAYLKAAGAARLLGEAMPSEALVLGADTVVIAGHDLIGKASDAAEARHIIEVLSDREHLVITGVALLDPASGRRAMFSDSASVAVGRLSEAEIEAYVRTGLWAGKAGAYNLEERVQAGWPLRWEGDATTVVGLPMGRLAPLLRRWGVAGSP